MRKLGILIAIAGIAALGFSGTAVAQEAEVTDAVKSVGCPLNNSPQSPGDGAPAGEECEGYEGFDFEDPEASLTTYVCGVAKGAFGITTEHISPDIEEGITSDENYQENCVEPTGCEGDECNDPNDPGDDGGNGKGDIGSNSGGSPDPEVKGKNQAADGGLPRTGGELFAGAGLGLAGLGTFLRRFLLR